jgi:hypothetical protein
MAKLISWGTDQFLEAQTPAIPRVSGDDVRKLEDQCKNGGQHGVEEGEGNHYGFSGIFRGYGRLN